MKPDVARQSGPADPRDPCARFLDGCHQRIGQNQRPEHGEAELGADLRIGRNAAGIVVRSTGDKSRPKETKQARRMRNERSEAFFWFAGRFRGTTAAWIIRSHSAVMILPES